MYFLAPCGTKPLIVLGIDAQKTGHVLTSPVLMGPWPAPKRKAQEIKKIGVGINEFDVS